MKKLMLVVFSILIISIPSFTSGKDGGSMDTGGGTGFTLFHTDAWFTYSRPIEYCVEVSEDFKVPRQTVIETIEFSFSQWSKLYSHFEKRINNWGLVIQATLSYNEDCSDEIDLAFYLGDIPLKYKPIADRHDHLAAFVHPLEVKKDEVTSSRGFVYVRNSRFVSDKLKYAIPKWENHDNIYAVLLHEIGHLFGVSHLPHTIMDKDILFRLRMEPSLPGTLENEFKMTLAQRKQISHLFNILPNEKINKIQARFEEINWVLTFLPDDKFDLTDGTDDYTFTPTNPRISVVDNGPYVSSQRYFIINSQQGFQYRRSAKMERYSQFGILHWGGKPFPAVYEKNINFSHHRVSIFKNKKWTLLFMNN